MSELFRKVLCSERLPEKESWYETSEGCVLYDPAKKCFRYQYKGSERYPEWWLEPVNEPNDEEIEKMAKKKWGTITGRFAFRQGYKQAIEDLKGGNNGLHR